MTNPNKKHMEILSQWVLGDGSFATSEAENLRELRQDDLPCLLSLANSHHVVIRGLQVFERLASASGKADWADWARSGIEAEHGRIQGALNALQLICSAFQAAGSDITVIKSLDHWPDLGSDLDLYTNAEPGKVIEIMTEHFQAKLEPRSWGDRLARKWNFMVPGLNELVEIHVGRLGQTGEHVNFARAIPVRSQVMEAGPHKFPVPCAEHRLIIATLQRMYRHFYLRLCDVADTAQLLETRSINFQFLRTCAGAAGIWDGVATFLGVVSDYVQKYRGRPVDLPAEVRSAARLGADRISFQKGFLRVPILPVSAGLYASEWTTLMKNGELRGTLRLSLLPCLATAAALEQKITGSDKGIW
jgi:hypothetical protein